jgi:hypothetical protein
MNKRNKVILVIVSVIVVAVILFLVIKLNQSRSNDVKPPAPTGTTTVTATAASTLTTSATTVKPKQITITIDKIGVHDNREEIIRGLDGEVYVYAVASNGKDTTKIRLPLQDGNYYKLAKEEILNAGTSFTLVGIPDGYLELAIIGYENDGEGFEQQVYDALELVINMQLNGSVGLFMDLLNIQINDIIGKFLGDQDDYLGSYNHKWTAANNWGAGVYSDIPCLDERGTPCLRLWFTVEVE